MKDPAERSNVLLVLVFKKRWLQVELEMSRRAYDPSQFKMPMSCDLCCIPACVLHSQPLQGILAQRCWSSCASASAILSVENTAREAITVPSINPCSQLMKADLICRQAKRTEASIQQFEGAPAVANCRVAAEWHRPCALQQKYRGLSGVLKVTCSTRHARIVGHLHTSYQLSGAQAVGLYSLCRAALAQLMLWRQYRSM